MQKVSKHSLIWHAAGKQGSRPAACHPAQETWPLNLAVWATGQMSQIWTRLLDQGYVTWTVVQVQNQAPKDPPDV